VNPDAIADKVQAYTRLRTVKTAQVLHFTTDVHINFGVSVESLNWVCGHVFLGFLGDW
jgi:hypothetical protein